MGCMFYQLNEQEWLEKDHINSKDNLNKHRTIITRLWERQLDKPNHSQSQPATSELAN